MPLTALWYRRSRNRAAERVLLKNKKTVYGVLRTVSSLVFVFALLVTPICLAGSEPAAVSPTTDTAVPEIETGIREIKKYGNLVLTVSPDTMIALGFEPGDTVYVSIGGVTVKMPVGTAFSNVDTLEPICCFRTDDGSEPQICLAINMGDFATTYGIAVKTRTQEAPGYRWDYCEGFGDDATVKITLAEKQGYADEYLLRQLDQRRSNVRADYPALTDAEYANFRAVELGGIGVGTLYRSSSPVNPKYSRSREADAAAEAAGIRTVMNMADSSEGMAAYEGYAFTYYAQCDVIALNLGMDHNSEDFRSGLAEGLRFFIAHEGPYLIHCNEGKDRTGFAAAILECLMGAKPDEVVADYMLTYENYYGVKPGTEQYERISARNIEQALSGIFSIESIRDSSANLALCAEKYLLDIGLTGDEIIALKANLGADYGGLGGEK